MPRENQPAIEVAGLHKRYGDTIGLDGISLEVLPGEIHGLIGPDGAGKTTLMRIVCGLLLQDQGHCRVLGFDSEHDSRQVKEHLGYMPQRFSLYPDLTVGENLTFFADLYHVTGTERRRQTTRLLEFSGLGPFVGRRAGQLSGGMKQKLALSCTLIHTPQVLVLDEPTTGVDVVSRREFWTILRELADEGMALLVSTPYMDEAERFARLVLVHRGRSVSAGTPEQIVGRFGGRVLEIAGGDQQTAWQRLRASTPPGCRVHRFGDRLHLLCHETPQADQIQQLLHGLDVRLRPGAPSIEDAFVGLVGSGEDR